MPENETESTEVRWAWDQVTAIAQRFGTDGCILNDDCRTLKVLAELSRVKARADAADAMEAALKRLLEMCVDRWSDTDGGSPAFSMDELRFAKEALSQTGGPK